MYKYKVCPQAIWPGQMETTYTYLRLRSFPTSQSEGIVCVPDRKANPPQFSWYSHVVVRSFRFTQYGNMWVCLGNWSTIMMVHIDVSLLEGICPQRKNIIQTGGPLKNDKLIWVLDPSNPRAHPSYLLLLPPPVANLAFHFSKMFSWLSSASTHVVFTWSHVLFTWSHIPSGGWAVNVLFCTCSHVGCYASHVFFTWSHIPSVGGGC
jgi:hypothetical protein